MPRVIIKNKELVDGIYKNVKHGYDIPDSIPCPVHKCEMFFDKVYQAYICPYISCKEQVKAKDYIEKQEQQEC